jgi:hypothetical protein
MGRFFSAAYIAACGKSSAQAGVQVGKLVERRCAGATG